MSSTKSSGDHEQIKPHHEQVSTYQQNERNRHLPRLLSITHNSRKSYSSFDVESRSLVGVSSLHGSKYSTEWPVILRLAFQSIGIVYGDIGTSPLYVFASTFTSGIKHEDDILGVLSLIFYTLTLIPLVKYVFIILRANNNGDGGTFALYSLICRHAKVGLTPKEESDDDPGNDVSMFQSKVEKNKFAKYFLLLATMLGTAMVIGDGILTPCISVLSAVGGIKDATSNMTQDMIVWISVAILILLFMVQRFGIDKVGYAFAPIICAWFVLIAGIGFYNFMKFDHTVVKAINPYYILNYFKRNKKEAWISLGGVVLSITGTEALFADVGHFTVRSIQISMCTVTYPALVLAYTGQASFLRKHADLVHDTFYKCIPERLYWPMFVVAVLASIIASQAMISGSFSIIQQSLTLGCFPSVKIVHTSKNYEGQVYIPEANYLLMIACVAVTLAFRSTTKIGNAYGIAVVFVMTLTSSFLVLIMVMIWKTNKLLIIAYVLIIGSLELLYLSSVLYKFNQGGYLPLALAVFLTIMMFVWNDVYRRKCYYELEHKVSLEELDQITSNANIRRIPGLAMFHSELVHVVPPVFKHYVTNVPVLHSLLVFVSVQSLPLCSVSPHERFSFRRVEPRAQNFFLCVVRLGYNDAIPTGQEIEPFEKLLVENLKKFVKDDFRCENIDRREEMLDREIEAVDRAWLDGFVHLIAESEVAARMGTGIGKVMLIDYVYNFMKRNLRQTSKVFDIISHKNVLKISMTYEL